MKMVRSSYYYYEKRSQLTDKYKDIKDLIKQIYDYHKGRFGYRRITLIIRQKGIIINHKTVLGTEHEKDTVLAIKKYSKLSIIKNPNLQRVRIFL